MGYYLIIGREKYDDILSSASISEPVLAPNPSEALKKAGMAGYGEGAVFEVAVDEEGDPVFWDMEEVKEL